VTARAVPRDGRPLKAWRPDVLFLVHDASRIDKLPTVGAIAAQLKAGVDQVSLGQVRVTKVAPKSPCPQSHLARSIHRRAPELCAGARHRVASRVGEMQKKHIERQTSCGLAGLGTLRKSPSIFGGRATALHGRDGELGHCAPARTPNWTLYEPIVQRPRCADAIA